jgi:ABC-type multidrug transport system fused ATPase/permease subunit
MIARALARHPRLLILDEATSALDNRTQAIITRAIDGLNITRIVIAHRLSTIINADKIVVLDNGHVVEQGTYEELMRLGGTFTALARRQLRS